MQRTVNVGLIVLFLFSLSSCNGQTPSETATSTNTTSSNEIVGSGCDGCELMYIGIPETISAVDTSSAWNEEGQRLLVKGKVLRLDKKTPAPNVIIYYWQTDNDGYYSAGTGASENHGHIRGWVQSDEQGNYAIYTIRPANYPNTGIPAHIHLSIKEPDIKDEYYTDDLVFDDDIKLTKAERGKLKNRGGSGILRPLIDQGVQVAEHDVILGLNIPNYPIIPNN